jgi:hypothetical protein
MTFRNVKLDDKTYKMLDICREIFLTHHPHTEKHWLSCNKIIREALLYYIKTEPDFKHLVDGDDVK